MKKWEMPVLVELLIVETAQDWKVVDEDGEVLEDIVIE